MKIKVVICGVRFGVFYLKALLKNKDLFEVVGILGKSGGRSEQYSKALGIPFFTDVNELPEDIEIACVILRSGVLGGEGINIAKELLKRGIHVVHEQPVQYEELIDVFKLSKSMDRAFFVTNFYKYIRSTEFFIKVAKYLHKKEEITHISMECGHQVVYSVMGILSEIMGSLRNFKIVNYIRSGGPFDYIECKVSGVPCMIKIHNEMDSDDPDNYFLLLYKIQVGFNSGDLIIEDPSGPVLWYSRVFIKHEFSFQTFNEKIFQRKNVTILSEATNYSTIFKSEWIDAITRQLEVVCDRPMLNYNRYAQNEMYISKRWRELMGTIGYPREKKIKRIDNITDFTLLEIKYKVLLDSRQYELILKELDKETIRRKVKDLETACMFSMLRTIQSLSGNSKRIRINDLLAKTQNRYTCIVTKWIDILNTSHFIDLENEEIIYKCKISEKQENKEWELAENSWTGSLSDKSVIQYYKDNAKELPRLLKGECNANELLFIEGTDERARDFYTYTLIGRVINDFMSREIIKNVTPNSKIVELGAGTGVSSEIILQQLDDHVEYIFTDLSLFFLEKAKRRFNNHRNVKYQILNIDDYFFNQNMKKESTDMVVAAGMLNNAYNLEFTLREIWRILKPGGWLFVAEPISDLLELLISQVFMMTRPVDIRSRVNQFFLKKEQWIDMFRFTGFKIIKIFPDDKHQLAELNQRLFVLKKTEE